MNFFDYTENFKIFLIFTENYDISLENFYLHWENNFHHWEIVILHWKPCFFKRGFFLVFASISGEPHFFEKFKIFNFNEKKCTLKLLKFLVKNRFWWLKLVLKLKIGTYNVVFLCFLENVSF